MRSATIAEFLLSLVMAPDRAAATAGDLVETSRGSFALWVALVRTCFGAIFHQLSVKLFFKAVGIEILLAVGLRALFGAMLFFGGTLIPSMAWPGPVEGLAWLLIPALLIPVFVGYLVALALPGRELAAWLSITLGMALCVGILAAGRIPAHLPFPAPAGLFTMLIGMLLRRRQWLRSQRTPNHAT